MEYNRIYDVKYEVIYVKFQSTNFLYNQNLFTKGEKFIDLKSIIFLFCLKNDNIYWYFMRLCYNFYTKIYTLMQYCNCFATSVLGRIFLLICYLWRDNVKAKLACVYCVLTVMVLSFVWINNWVDGIPYSVVLWFVFGQHFCYYVFYINIQVSARCAKFSISLVSDF